MNRRGMLARTALASALLVATSGCAQFLGELNIVDASIDSPSPGRFVLTVVVENTAPLLQSGTLIGRIDTDSGETRTKQQNISVPSNSSTSFEFEFGSGSDTLTNQSVEYSAEIQ